MEAKHNLVVLDNEPDLISHGELAEIYIAERTDWARATKASHKYSLRAFFLWLGPRPINPTVLQQYSDEMARTRSNAYAELIVKHACMFGRWLWKSGCLETNPALDVTKPRLIPQKPKPGFTPEEYQTMVAYLRDNLNKPNRAELLSFIIICLHTGMACTDACHLRWEEVDLEKGFIVKVRQKMKRRGSTCTIPIVAGTELEAELNRLRLRWPPGKKGFVNPDLAAWCDCSDATQKPEYNARRIMMAFHDLLEDLGIPQRGTHGFRRRLLTVLANDPHMNPFHAIEVSGHSSVDMLNRYREVDQVKLRESVEGTLKKFFDLSRPPSPDALRNPVSDGKIHEFLDDQP